MRKTVAVLLAGGLVAMTLGAAAPVWSSPTIELYVCFDRVGAGLTRPDSRGVIQGTPGNDVIVTRAVDVVVLGGDGRDRICAFGRRVYVSGGDDNDLISMGPGRDIGIGGTGDDYIDGKGGRDRLRGLAGTDTLVGGGRDDHLEGGDGFRDFLFGGRGSDLLEGGSGASDEDLLVGGLDADVIDGGSGGGDTVAFTFEDAGVQLDLTQPRPLVSTGDILAGIENVTGSVFDDRVIGSPEGNHLDGDDGADVLSGGDGDDAIEGGAGDDFLDGGAGGDTSSFLHASAGVQADLAGETAVGHGTDAITAFEHLSGSAYGDQLYGDDGANSIFGSLGDNLLLGRAGDDLLVRGGGDAGEGSDTCVDSSADNCEGNLHGDPPPSSLISSPSQGATVEIPRFRSIQGTAHAGAFGPEPRAVEVSLRRFSGSGCYWWDAELSVMLPWHCDRPIWNQTTFDAAANTWSRRVPRPVQLLAPGRYQVRSRIKQRGFVESFFAEPENIVEFRLVR